MSFNNILADNIDRGIFNGADHYLLCQMFYTGIVAGVIEFIKYLRGHCVIF